jgi:hypothetical protein
MQSARLVVSRLSGLGAVFASGIAAAQTATGMAFKQGFRASAIDVSLTPVAALYHKPSNFISYLSFGVPVSATTAHAPHSRARALALEPQVRWTRRKHSAPSDLLGAVSPAPVNLDALVKLDAWKDLDVDKIVTLWHGCGNHQPHGGSTVNSV